MLRIRDVYPGSRILIFTHSGSRIQKQQQNRGVKKISCHNFFCSHKFHKIVNYLIFGRKHLGQFLKTYRTFYPKKCHLALKEMGLGSGIWDPRSGIREKPIPDPGSRIRMRNIDMYRIG